MPVLDINTNHTSCYTCFDDVIGNCLSYLGYEYKMAFIKSWRFDYNKIDFGNKHPIGTSAFITYDEDIKHELLAKYHGVILNRHSNMQVKEYIRIMIKQLDKSYPCIITYNKQGKEPLNRESYVPWYHCYIVAGYNLEKKYFIIHDSYNQEKDIELKFDDITIESLVNVITFKIDDRNNSNIIMIKDGLKDGLSYIAEGQYIKKMQEYIDDIRNHLDLANEFSKKPIWDTPLSWAIIVYTKERVLFRTALEYLADLYESYELRKLIELLNNIVDKWYQSRSDLYHSYKNKDSVSITRELFAGKYEDILREEIKLKEGLMRLYEFYK